MSDLDRVAHEWFTRRLVLHHAGLLSGDEARRVAEHLAGCPACADALAAMRERERPGAAEAGHLPADLVAAWPRRAPGLRGIEQRLVRAHLERCASCRADLALLGYDPALVGAVVASGGEPAAAVAPARAERTPRGLVDRLRALVAERAWAVGTLATATAAIALVLLVRPLSPPPVLPTPDRPLPGSGEPPSASAPSPPSSPADDSRPGDSSPSLRIETRRADVEALEFGEPMRGGSSDSADVAAPPRASAHAGLRFEVPESFLRAELPDSVWIRLVDPAGRVRMSAHVASRSLYPHKVVAARVDERLSPGAGYRLSFAFTSRGGRSERRDYRFTLAP